MKILDKYKKLLLKKIPSPNQINRMGQIFYHIVKIEITDEIRMLYLEIDTF